MKLEKPIPRKKKFVITKTINEHFEHRYSRDSVFYKLAQWRSLGEFKKNFAEFVQIVEQSVAELETEKVDHVHLSMTGYGASFKGRKNESDEEYQARLDKAQQAIDAKKQKEIDQIVKEKEAREKAELLQLDMLMKKHAQVFVPTITEDPANRKPRKYS